MWFIVVLILNQPMPELTRAVSGFRFPTHTACMDDARSRFQMMGQIGVHGRYLCMYRGEPDEELTAGEKGAF